MIDLRPIRALNQTQICTRACASALILIGVSFASPALAQEGEEDLFTNFMCESIDRAERANQPIPQRARQMCQRGGAVLAPGYSTRAPTTGRVTDRRVSSSPPATSRASSSRRNARTRVTDRRTLPSGTADRSRLRAQLSARERQQYARMMARLQSDQPVSAREIEGYRAMFTRLGRLGPQQFLEAMQQLQVVNPDI